MCQPSLHNLSLYHWPVGCSLFHFSFLFCIWCSIWCQIAYGASNILWESMHRCSHLHEAISKIITFTCYSFDLKIEKKKREFVSYIQYASCRFSYMCDVCYRTLASGPLAIAKLKKQTLRISRVHSSIFGKFNTHSQEPPYLCIVACTRIRFCRRP